jgi:excisionase family DNA binding protein
MTYPHELAGRRALTPDELAEAWNIHPETVRRRLRSGKLQGFRIGEEWRIPISSIEAYEAENPEGSACFARPDQLAAS